ncbi:MAG TPA: serine/threonine-protein kinase, partial [Planctomycetota bacterium]|nr:serine/threonine-protein kinase [Planctomycetota bacterium]
LSHRNVVHVHDVDEVDGFLFYAMEYLEGIALDDLVKKNGLLSPSVAVPYIVQAAKGLEAAHKLGIIHRDVKPANLFLTKDGTIKLVDMGLSKDTTDQRASEHSMAGMAIGTPHYIAPEQARGLEGIDGRADIYGLGCTLYTLLTGTTPYSGPNPLAIMNKQINDPPPNPRAVIPTLPAAYTVLIELMMAKNPNDRYQNCTELVADLERVLAGKAPMGASVALSTDDGQDVPMLKRRAVTAATRGSGSTSIPTGKPATTGGRVRGPSALMLESPAGTGEGSSGFRRVGPSPRRTTSRFDRIEPRSEEMPTGAQDVPFFQRYALQLGVGTGAAVLILLFIVIMVAGSSRKPPPAEINVASHTEFPAGTTRPTGPAGPVIPGRPVTTQPTTPTPAPTPTPTPAAPVRPDDISPYEWSKLHPTAPAPAPPPAVPVSPAGSPDGVHPASYSPPPAGYKVALFVGGVREQTSGTWNRMEDRTEQGFKFIHWQGEAVPGLSDLQYPYFEFVSLWTMKGKYLIRGRARRNGKGNAQLRILVYGRRPEMEKINSFGLSGSGGPQEWFSFSGEGAFPTATPCSQFEIRPARMGTPGESVELEWLEFDEQINGPTEAVEMLPVTPGALLHADCSMISEGPLAWQRCSAQQEGRAGFMHWTFKGNQVPPDQVTAPMLTMAKGFSWSTNLPLTLRIRMRAHGAPRFNIGVKFWYHNGKGTSLVVTSRIDFDANSFGTWQERTIQLDAVENGIFDELELRPYEYEVADGTVDVDWVEILPKSH